MPKYSHINEAVADNQRLTCKVNGCTRPRYRISGYCRYHNRINSLYGSPYHRCIIGRDFAMEFAECLGVVCNNFNAGHPGIRYGLKFFHQWLTDAANGKPSVAGRWSDTVMDQFRRLHDAGVDPIDLLATSAALVLLQHRRPHSIRDGRHLVYVIGLRLLRTAPHAGKARGPLSREIGTHVWDNLKTLLVNIAGTVIKKEQEQDETLKVMHTPLSL